MKNKLLVEKYCVFCGKKETSDEQFLRYKPKGVISAKYLCEECVDEKLGGEPKATNWIITHFVHKIPIF